MKIKDLLVDESKWTKYAMARDENGENISFENPAACQFCLYGAFLKCYRSGGEFEMFATYHKICSFLGAEDVIIAFNDAELTTFEDIRSLVEKLDI